MVILSRNFLIEKLGVKYQLSFDEIHNMSKYMCNLYAETTSALEIGRRETKYEEIDIHLRFL